MSRAIPRAGYAFSKSSLHRINCPKGPQCINAPMHISKLIARQHRHFSESCLGLMRAGQAAITELEKDGRRVTARQKSTSSGTHPDLPPFSPMARGDGTPSAPPGCPVPRHWLMGQKIVGSTFRQIACYWCYLPARLDTFNILPAILPSH